MAPTKTIYSQGRHYVWPETKPHELVVPSVTTILSGGIPKPALAPWNAKMVATFAVKEKDAWVNLKEDDAIDLLKRSPFRTTDKSARAGTLIHKAIERYVEGGDHRLPPEGALRNQYEASLQFLTDFKVKVAFSEVTIFSREHEYAGTTDLVGGVVIPKLALPKLNLAQRTGTAIIDYKTGKRIYDEHSIQLNAYAFGDFIAGTEGKETKMPKVDWLIVIRPKKRGGYEAKVYSPSKAEFDLFLAARVISQRNDVLGDALVGRVLTGPDDEVE